MPSWATGSSQDLLARLKLPGRPGAAPAPASGVVEPPAPKSRAMPSPSRVGNAEAASAIAGALSQLAGIDSGARHGGDDSPLAEIQRLRAENRELRTLLDEMKHLLGEASEAEQQFGTREKELEALLAEKDSQIDELSAHLGTIEEQIAKGELAPPPPPPKTRSELEEWSDELEKESAKLQQEKKRLEEERRQLREDEDGLEAQMREMEVSMARERAMLARQETELKRLSAEIQHELDILQRGDAGLREQMARFQRRAQEVMNNPSGRR
jgi:chromosome segregation ATPase